MNHFQKCGLIAVMVLALAACAVMPDPDHAPQGKTRYNTAKARQVFDEILGRGRMELFNEMYQPDFVKHIDGQRRTLAQEIEDARYTRSLSSDLVITIDQLIAEGDSVAIRYTARGTHTGALGKLPPTGRKFVLSGMTVYRFHQGRIAEEWTVLNQLELMRQLGALGPSA